MNEYVIDGKGNAYRRLYVIFHDGEEIGALTTLDAVRALIDGAIEKGAEDSFYWNDYLQPVEHEKWLSESMQAVNAHKIESENGGLKKAVYTMNGWKAFDDD